MLTVVGREMKRQRDSKRFMYDGVDVSQATETPGDRRVHDVFIPKNRTQVSDPVLLPRRGQSADSGSRVEEPKELGR